jgi:hypothetical protein
LPPPHTRRDRDFLIVTRTTLDVEDFDACAACPELSEAGADAIFLKRWNRRRSSASLPAACVLRCWRT